MRWLATSRPRAGRDRETAERCSGSNTKPRRPPQTFLQEAFVVVLVAATSPVPATPVCVPDRLRLRARFVAQRVLSIFVSSRSVRTFVVFTAWIDVRGARR